MVFSQTLEITISAKHYHDNTITHRPALLVLQKSGSLFAELPSSFPPSFAGQAHQHDTACSSTHINTTTIHITASTHNMQQHTQTPPPYTSLLVRITCSSTHRHHHHTHHCTYHTASTSQPLLYTWRGGLQAHTHLQQSAGVHCALHAS